MTAPRCWISLLVLSTVPALQGCCTTSRWFCGADKSDWVRQDWSTPQQAIATFKEALRREDTTVLYYSLSESLRDRMGLTAAATAIATDQFAEKGMFMAGYAEVTELPVADTDHAAFRLEVAGRVLHVGLVRQPYHEFEVRDRAAGAEVNRVLPRSLGGKFDDTAELVDAVELLDDGFQTRASIELPPQDTSGVQAEDIVRLAIGHSWKVDEFRVEQDD